MSTATVATEDDVRRTRWLTLDEVVEKLRFPTRRALFAHLRRHPAPVYQRVGSRRYFMKADDVDQMMAPIDLRVSATRRGEVVDEGPGEFVQVSPPSSTKTNGKPARPPKTSKTKTTTTRR